MPEVRGFSNARIFSSPRLKSGALNLPWTSSRTESILDSGGCILNSSSVNICVNLLWLIFSLKRKGGRLIYRQLFSLRQMLTFLRQAVDKIHEVVEGIYLPSG